MTLRIINYRRSILVAYYGTLLNENPCWLQRRNLSSIVSKNASHNSPYSYLAGLIPSTFNHEHHSKNHKFNGLITKSQYFSTDPDCNQSANKKVENIPRLITKNIYLYNSEKQRDEHLRAGKEQKSKKLVILATWLEAEEKHIKKYRQFYLDRSLDVMNVKTNAIDVLFPKHYVKRTCLEVVQFLNDNDYDKVFFHGLSVGGLIYAQTSLELLNIENTKLREKLCDSIRGIVIDSAVVISDWQAGVANSVTNNKYIAQVLHSLMTFYTFAARHIATRYYEMLQAHVFSGPLNRPSMMVYSKTDPIINYKNTERFADSWIKAGIEMDRFVVEDVGHVESFRKHHDEYAKRLDRLLKRIEML